MRRRHDGSMAGSGAGASSPSRNFPSQLRSLHGYAGGPQVSEDTKRQYRSAAWFGKHDKDGFIHRSWMRNQGLPADVFDGRPVVGICNTWSELTPCNAHLRTIAEHVKRGV